MGDCGAYFGLNKSKIVNLEYYIWVKTIVTIVFSFMNLHET